jgi:hypothetical protein
MVSYTVVVLAHVMAHYNLGKKRKQKRNNNKHAYASQLNSFTHLRALLVLLDRGIQTGSFQL